MAGIEGERRGGAGRGGYACCTRVVEDVGAALVHDAGLRARQRRRARRGADDRSRRICADRRAMAADGSITYAGSAAAPLAVRRSATGDRGGRRLCWWCVR
ncbi:hypothetical protein ZWY2020_042222 [Hordeum vulgare]|nr:hypothetical protein ZWY2020_042222 [Hordeum vulgare]